MTSKMRAPLVALLALSTLAWVLLAIPARQPPRGVPAHVTHFPKELVRPNRSRVLQGYGKLPLSFEANQGQTDPEVKFLSRGSGYTLFLTAAEAVLALVRPADVPDVALARIYPDQVGSPPRFHAPAGLPAASGQVLGGAARAEPPVLRMKLLGANAAPRAEGLKELPGKSNYFLGNDPKKWSTNVDHYAQVRYREVYPGVDLVYYGNQRQLEHDFVVAPGVNPSDIRLGFEGAGTLSIDAQGDLLLATTDAELRLRKPIIYQDVGGVRQEIAGGYVLKGGQEVGFQVGAYDVSKPLIIDPVFVYSTYLGGGGDDIGESIAVDAEGNAYIAGLTVSRDFPTANPLQPDYGGGSADAFVAKLTPDGSALVYSTYLGGSEADAANGIAVDSDGNAYVTGQTSSRDFPTANALQPELSGFINAFIAKLSPDGSTLIYSTYLGGSNQDIGVGIAVDRDGNAYVTGATTSTDFPTAHPLQASYGGGVNDGFVTKLSADGSALVYSTYVGGRGGEFGESIAVDAEGCAYVTGSTNSTDFPTANPLQPEYGGGDFDAYVLKLSPDGSALVYSTYFGGRGTDLGGGIAVDAEGNAYLAGKTRSPDFPTANPLQPELRGSDDAFVAKLDPTGKALIYSTYLGGRGGETGAAIAVDGEGNAYVAGQTSSRDFPTVDALQPDYGGGAFDAFVAKVNADGSALVHSTYLGGSSADAARGMAVDAEGNAYVAGFTLSNNFPTANALQPDLAGLENAFVAKVASDSRRNGRGPGHVFLDPWEWRSCP